VNASSSPSTWSDSPTGWITIPSNSPRAIISDPLLIVADEPTGDLDRVSAADILDLLDRLNRELGKTIVMVTHDQRAADHARLVRHLDKGELTNGETAG